MSTVTKHTPGTFCWWELSTHDLEADWRFYHALFRWEKRDQFVGPGQVYRIAVLEGQDVGALYRLQTAAPGGRPGAWLPYIAVQDADATLARITSSGGTQVQPVVDVVDAGRMALFADTEGATAAIWEPRAHPGAGIMDEVGTVCWNELSAKDAERARGFYTAAFDWKPERKSLGAAGEYTFWDVAGAPRVFGGMLQMTPEWGDPPAWMTYFKVADCDESAALAADHGGTILYPPFDAPGVGRIAVLEDPTGSRFSVIRFSTTGQ